MPVRLTKVQVYSDSEIEDIGRLLSTLNLKLLDCHGSDGREKCWFSLRESERRAGVELVKNRVDFTRRLGGDCVVMHIVRFEDPAHEAKLISLRQSLKELEPFCRDRHIRLALENHLPMENSSGLENYEKVLIPVIEAWPADYVGFCLDVGHHNVVKDLADYDRKNSLRDRLADRLIATHIHDNCGEADNHWIPFTGSVDWDGVVKFLHRAKYRKTLNLELSFGSAGRVNKERYTRDAYKALTGLQAMVDSVV